MQPSSLSFGEREIGVQMAECSLRAARVGLGQDTELEKERDPMSKVFASVLSGFPACRLHTKESNWSYRKGRNGLYRV